MIMCGRCGIRHYADALCGAWNAKCLKCYKYGHFARVCRTSSADPAVRYKLQMKKNRDTERMTAFLRRKDFENLPFNTLTNNELQSMRFNSLRRLNAGSSRKQKQDKEILCAKVGGLEASIGYLRVENADIKSNLKSSEDKINGIIKENSELQSASSRKDNRIKQLLAQSEKLQTKRDRYKKTIKDQEVRNGKLYRENLLLIDAKCNLDDANTTIQTLRSEQKNMEREVQGLRAENANIKMKVQTKVSQDTAEIERLTLKNEALYKDNVKHSEYKYQVESANKEVTKMHKANKINERKLLEERRNHNKALEKKDTTIRELEESVNKLLSVIRNSKTDISNLTTFMSRIGGERKMVKCIACGSSFAHFRHRCSIDLIGTECAMCKRQNHFSVLCADLNID